MIDVVEKYSLQSLNTLAIPSVARHFVAIHGETSLLEAIHVADQHQWKVSVLGGGSNVLAQEIIEGLVIKNEIQGIQLLSDNDDHVIVEVGAGENWHETVQCCISQGWYGLENLSLIPGTVGAAPIQNIGAYGVEVREFIESVRAYDCVDRVWRDLNNKACEFDYRDSLFKRSKNRFIVTAIRLRLNKTFHAKLSYGALQHLEPSTITAQQLSEEICRIRLTKLPDPKDLPNAGSFFKNPVVSMSHYQELVRKYPHIVAFDAGDQRKKLAAGWLIENAGLKGYRDPVWGVGTHVEQALVLVNPQRRSLVAVMSVVEIIRQAVKENYGIELEIEPQILGDQMKSVYPVA
ncbi:UDP-N-acetylmuramate dehydrogenase [Gynuella sp.]|uniref:UDP-N-acetylmuramate dehydrogenase n=1 Tax=Gynuella sp. TaxID=2969146 RepID=UPI003D11A7E8